MSDKDLCPESGVEIPAAASHLPRPVFLPLLALLLLTLVTQLGSLPYIMGRAEQGPGATMHSFVRSLIFWNLWTKAGWELVQTVHRVSGSAQFARNSCRHALHRTRRPSVVYFVRRG